MRRGRFFQKPADPADKGCSLASRRRVGMAELFQTLVEPCDSGSSRSTWFSGLHEEMAFAGINDQLCRHAERL